MNIFVFSLDPQQAARMHCDKHCIKMILEYAQLLSTAHRVLDSSLSEKVYKATHVNHPCSVWVRSSSDNYEWLYELFVALCGQYAHRYNKTHLTETKLKSILRVLPENIPIDRTTPFVQAMPEQYKNYDPIQAYRNYFNGEKQKIAQWTNVPVPCWFNREEQCPLLGEVG